MNRIFRTVCGSAILLAFIIAGFSGGKAIGARLRPHSESSLSPWTPGVGNKSAESLAPPAPPSELFASVLDKVRQDYVCTTGTPPVSNARLTSGAIGRMIASLNDPRAVYLNPSQTELRVNSLLGRQLGIGAELAIVHSRSAVNDVTNSYLTIRSVFPGSPAERAGLRTGDRITEIDGQWVIAYPVEAESGNLADTRIDSKHNESNPDPASQIKPGISATRSIMLLTSGEGKSLKLTAAKSNGGMFTVDVTTGQTAVPAVSHALMGAGISYIRVAQFNADAAKEVNTILGRRQDWFRGLIVDLRQNGGGVEADNLSRVDGFQCALDLMGYIVQQPEIAVVERRPGERITIKAREMRPKSIQSARISVLIDGGTSNIAEMVADGMRSAGGAKLIGSRTFGDDVLSHLSILKDGGAIELVCGHLFTLSGHDIAEGVNPDIPVQQGGNIGGDADKVMIAAKQYVLGR